MRGTNEQDRRRRSCWVRGTGRGPGGWPACARLRSRPPPGSRSRCCATPVRRRPTSPRALVMDLACQRPVDLGYAVDLRASDLPRAYAGKTAEAAGHPRLAMVATGSARHPGGRPDRAPQDGPLLRASRPQLRGQDARRAAAPRAAVLPRRRGATWPPSRAASGSCPRPGTAPGRTWSRAFSRR